MRWPWQWRRRDPPKLADDQAPAQAVQDQRAKLAEARDRQPEVHQAVRSFTDQVAAAIARREPR